MPVWLFIRQLKRSKVLEVNELSGTYEFRDVALRRPTRHGSLSELRCVVIGDKIFSAKIHSQANEQTRKDWRAGETHLERFSLPQQVEVSIHRLMESFGINFASLDMIVTPEGESVFLELNPNGQWLWIEEELGFPLVATMADLLTTYHSSKREPGVRPLLPVS